MHLATRMSCPQSALRSRKNARESRKGEWSADGRKPWSSLAHPRRRHAPSPIGSGHRRALSCHLAPLPKHGRLAEATRSSRPYDGLWSFAFSPWFPPRRITCLQFTAELGSNGFGGGRRGPLRQIAIFPGVSQMLATLSMPLSWLRGLVGSTAHGASSHSCCSIPLCRHHFARREIGNARHQHQTASGCEQSPYAMPLQARRPPSAIELGWHFRVVNLITPAGRH